jgi:hypothetical protein
MHAPIDRNDSRVTSRLASLQRIGDRVRANQSGEVEAYAFTLILRSELLEFGWDTSLAEDGYTVLPTEHKEQ